MIVGTRGTDDYMYDRLDMGTVGGQGGGHGDLTGEKRVLLWDAKGEVLVRDERKLGFNGGGK